MKYVMIVGDGMADLPIAELGGRTPLQYLDMPHMRLLAGGELGRVRTCPEGVPPGSDTAFLSLTGNDPRALTIGRAALEAAGAGVDIHSGETAFRMNLVSIENSILRSHNGGGVNGSEALELARFLQTLPEFQNAGMRITPSDTFRHIAVLPSEGSFPCMPPHDIAGQAIDPYLPESPVLRELMLAAARALEKHPINERRAARGDMPVNGVWFWGAGAKAELRDFSAAYGVRGAAVTAVPLVRGIARLCGMEAPEKPEFTGLLDTDYEGKAAMTLSVLRGGVDFALMHLEAPDEMSHEGSLDKKLEAIRRLDRRAIAPLLAGLAQMGEYRVLLLPDHYTLLSTRTHDGTPVPYALFDSRAHGAPRPFCESACEDFPVCESGDALLREFFNI